MDIRLVSAITVALSLLGCVDSRQDTLSTDSDAQAIEQLFEQFTAAFNDEDLELLRSLYTEDALLIPPGQASVTGPDAIIDQMWAPTFDNFEVEAELPIDEIQSEDGWGFVRGTYQMQLDPSDGSDPIREEGRYIDVVRKDANGVWKIARAIWNTTGS